MNIILSMRGHKIINQNALHYITFTVVGWIDVFSNDDYRKNYNLKLIVLSIAKKKKGWY